ncbi:MAG TPA: FtsX-like permease family protein, partial [Candidatus Elarobacter sp.]
AIAAAGVVMAIGASIVPAYRASAEPPALAVRGPERQPSPRAGRASIVTATAAAGAAAAAAFVALLHPGVGIATGTVTAVLVAALAALPLGVRTATSRLRAATRNLSGSERLAAINVGTPPGRAALTVATFAVAVATIVCAAVVIDSSRSTVTLWARRTHAAELTVTGAPFDLRAIERVRGIEGVADVVRTRDELDVSPTPSANLSRLRVEVVAALAPQPVEIVTSGELRRHLGEVFGAVFAATSALAALAAALGIGGVVGSLMAVVLERREELALLRYLGLSRAALRTLLLAEALFVATLGGGLGTVLGFGFAAVLLFGSHTVEAGGALRWSPSYPSIAAALLFAVAAVLAGALIPARMAARIRTDEVLQST